MCVNTEKIGNFYLFIIFFVDENNLLTSNNKNKHKDNMMSIAYYITYDNIVKIVQLNKMV